MRMKRRLQQSEGRNRCNPIDILWEYSLHRERIYKGNLWGIERNRRLMPSRRFLAVDVVEARAMLSANTIGISNDLPRFDDRTEAARDRDLSSGELLSPKLPPLHPPIAHERP